MYVESGELTIKARRLGPGSVKPSDALSVRVRPLLSGTSGSGRLARWVFASLLIALPVLAIFTRVMGGSTRNGFGFGEAIRLAVLLGIFAVLFGYYAVWLNRRQAAREWVVIDITPTSAHAIAQIAVVGHHSRTTATDLAAEMASAGFPVPT